MSSIKESAERFFHACETGGGWESCKEFCMPRPHSPRKPAPSTVSRSWSRTPIG